MDDYKSGHRNRIKAKYLENSANIVYDYEVLKLLLTYSIPRRDVKPVAKALLERFGSLDKVCSASKEQLCAVNGIGENSAILIKLVTDLQSRCAKCRNGGNCGQLLGQHQHEGDQGRRGADRQWRDLCHRFRG